MVKRLLIIGLLSISLMALLVTEEAAGCVIKRGKLFCGSLCAETLLRGVGNLIENPVDVCVALYIEEVEARCWNKPGNSGQAQGTAFFPGIMLTDDTLVYTYHLIDERGSAEVPLCWDWEADVYAPIIEYAYSHQVCPNYNWYIDLESLKIRTMYVYHSAYEEDKYGNLVPSSKLCRKCYYGGFECGFSCSTVSTSQCTGRGLGSACDGAVP